MTGRPEVSVVVPTRDRWQLLSRHALPSALGQEGVDIEVIVVDDGSIDGTPDRIEDLGEPRVRLLRQAVSQGAAAAKNVGIAAARSPWVAFLDDDDLWSPAKLATQLATIGNAGWGYCGGVVVDERLEIVDVLAVRPAAGIATELRRGNVVAAGSSSVIAQTSLLRSVGGFDETLRGPDDWDLWLRLASCAPAAADAELLVATLEHPGRWIFRDPRLEMRSIDVFLDKIEADGEVRKGVAEWAANERYRGGKRLQASALYFRAAVRFRSPGNALPGFAAPFGDHAMRAAAGLLRLAAGGSHLDLDRRSVPAEPDWLARRGAELRAA